MNGVESRPKNYRESMQQHMQKNGVKFRPDSSRKNMQEKKKRQSMADDQLTRRRKKVESCKACWTYDCSTAFRYFAALPFSPVNYFATLSNLGSWYKHMHVGPCGALYPLKSTPSILCRTSREAEHLMHSHTAFHPCGCHRISGPR